MKASEVVLESLSLLMVDFRAVLILFSPLNELSAVVQVTGENTELFLEL